LRGFEAFRLETPEAVVLVTAEADEAVDAGVAAAAAVVDDAVAPDVVGVVVVKADVAGGATTVPLFKLTAPNEAVTGDNADVVMLTYVGILVASVKACKGECPLAIGDGPFVLNIPPANKLVVEEDDLVWCVVARGGNLSAESPVVRLRCLDEDEPPFSLEEAAAAPEADAADEGSSGGKGEATTLTTGAEAAGTAFISTLRPSRTTTSSPILWVLLWPFIPVVFLPSNIKSTLTEALLHLPSRVLRTL
jgi:hypothetical protein